MARPRLPDAGLRAEARHAYGLDPIGYDEGRPAYPERVFGILEERCGLASAVDVLEIGPGTGRVTRRLLASGARVTAVEPDPALAGHLGDQMPDIDVVASAFEDAELPDERFDLVVAATSWHWVDQTIGLPKLGRIVRPGGWVALWWERFGDRTRPDPFADVIAASMPAPRVPPDGRPPFEEDEAGWREVLTSEAGLIDVGTEVIRGTVRLEAVGARALFASMILVRRLPARDQELLLDGVVETVNRDFGGAVDHPCVTAIHTARRPEHR